MNKSKLEEHYKNTVREKLQKKFNYKNPHQIPQLVKVVVSMGLAKASADKQHMTYVFDVLKQITGQKPLQTKAKKSISNFKLRENQVIGGVVTLRKHKMYDFIYKLTNVNAPRISDFRGFRRKADGRGNYSLGLQDQAIFYEVDLDAMKFAQGMNVTFVTTAQTDEECLALLEYLDVPLKK